MFVPTFKAIRPGYLARLLRSSRVQQRWPAMQQKLREVGVWMRGVDGGDEGGGGRDGRGRGCGG